MLQRVSKGHVQRHLGKAEASWSWFLDGVAQSYTLIRLELNDQSIATARGHFRKDHMRRITKHDNNLRVTCTQLLACTQIKRCARPTPIANFHLHRHKALGAALRIARMVTVAAFAALGAVLAAHNVTLANRLKCFDHFHLLVAHRIRRKLGGRFHRREA